MAGTGRPPLTMNWSYWHLLSTVSGWANINLWKSSLKIRSFCDSEKVEICGTIRLMKTR
jgi:hypothetical protein